MSGTDWVEFNETMKRVEREAKKSRGKRVLDRIVFGGLVTMGTQVVAAVHPRYPTLMPFLALLFFMMAYDWVKD